MMSTHFGRWCSHVTDRWLGLSSAPGEAMQRASAAFGLLIFGLWLAVLAVGLAYVTVWATTQRRPQWRILNLLRERDGGLLVDRAGGTGSVVSLAAIRGRYGRVPPEAPVGSAANVIPFSPGQAQSRRRL